jgi:hypothetical protein
VDRRINPRLGARVAGHLMAALNTVPGPLRAESITRHEDARVIRIAADSFGYALILPDRALTLAEGLALAGTDGGRATSAVDLESGEVVTVQRGRAGPGDFAGREVHAGVAAPMLVIREGG